MTNLAEGRSLTVRKDMLSEVFHTLQLSGTLYCRAELRAPWGIAIPAMDGHMGFGVITSGRVWFEMEGVEPQWLEAGSLMLIPHGTAHRMSHAPGAPCDKLFDLPVDRVSEHYELLTYGGNGDIARATYGVVRFGNRLTSRLMSQLPRAIFHRDWDQESGGWMQGTISFISGEAASLKPGGEIVLTRLADILVIQAIRSWLATAPEARQGWLAAARDEHIGQALSAIHHRPEAPWTVEALASEAGMSRSAFSARFTAIVGESAMRYVTRWRMEVAQLMLMESDAPLVTVAERVGYRSEAAFSRAFKKVLGVAPGRSRYALQTSSPLRTT